jgi:hypothetical protein
LLQAPLTPTHAPLPPNDPSQALGEAWGPCLPPPPDADAASNGPPLPWWDEMRYWVHGRLALRVDDLDFLQVRRALF